MIANLADAEVVISEQATTIEALRTRLAECETIKQRAVENKSIETEAHWKTQKELEAVKAKLAEVQRERDSLDLRLKSAQALRSDTYQSYLRVIRERDDARRWAAVWKRSAKMWRLECLSNAGAKGSRRWTWYMIMRQLLLTNNDDWDRFVAMMEAAKVWRKTSRLRTGMSIICWESTVSDVVYFPDGSTEARHVPDSDNDWRTWLEAGQVPAPF